MASVYESLGLVPGCGVAAVKASWRSLATKHHPDHDGDPAVFSMLRSDYVAALAEEQALEALCKACGGSGFTEIGSGWNKLKILCNQCK